MKAKWFSVFVLVTLVVALIPVGVLAAAPMELKVFVRNTTGGDVDLRLTDADGNFHWMTIAAGVKEYTLTEGKYEYYAVTACGTQLGVWNLNVSKQLDIHCKDGMLEFDLAKRCEYNYAGTLWYDSVNNVHLYVEGDYANVPDGPYSQEIYVMSGMWPKWENGGQICWTEFKSMDPFNYPDEWYDVWFLPFEWD